MEPLASPSSSQIGKQSVAVEVKGERAEGEARRPEWAARMMFDAWCDVNETVRDAVRLRWDVTKTYLATMAAIVAAAVVLWSKGAPSIRELAVGLTWLTLLSLIPQCGWQFKQNLLIVRFLKKSGELSDALDTVLSKEGFVGAMRFSRDGSKRAVVTPRDAWEGFVGVTLVSVFMSIAAAVLVFHVLSGAPAR